MEVQPISNVIHGVNHNKKGPTAIAVSPFIVNGDFIHCQGIISKELLVIPAEKAIFI